MRTRLFRAAAVTMSALGLVAATAASAAADAGHSPGNGSGSSWSANAVNQWIADVSANGLQVTFTGSGSAVGRKDFHNKTTDFAVSDIGFQGRDAVTGDSDDAGGRPYGYLPIVAGGTAFPYHVERAGQLVRNLRLSGDTLAKIFTNKITNWSDPQIAADNNGQALPDLQIIPVVHSEGSGSTAQFTTYLTKQYGQYWGPFNGGNNSLTEYYPRQGAAVAQNGSDGVMNYIASAAANGAIGFDEYSYALGKNYPVAKLQNANGYYNLPTQYNVAVALTQAHINTDKNSPDYLLQDLSDVYTYRNDRSYPLSSYSYMILPTGDATSDTTLTTGKRQTLADYLYYSLCEGQKEMGPIGYSPLPLNLVQASFDQTAKLKAADPAVDISKRDVTTCNNPTFDPSNPGRNYLEEIAPAPPACDKQGAGPCGGPGDSGTGVAKTGGIAAGPANPGAAAAAAKAGTSAARPGVAARKPGANAAAAGGKATTPAAAGTRSAPAGAGAAALGAAGTPAGAAVGTGAGPAGAANGTGTVAGAVSGGGAAAAPVDPVSGDPLAADAGAAVAPSLAAGDAASGGVAPTVASPALAASTSSSMSGFLGPLALLELLTVLVAPPLAARAIRRRRAGTGA